METKYYTPTIEEFNHNFEYLEREDGDVFSKQVFDFMDLDVIDDQIREDKIRVKHLDREDIESLGWKIRADDNRDLRIPEYTIARWYFKTYSGGFCTIYDDTAVDQYCFRGNIKNKSELKKLMQQLNIETNEDIKS